MRTSTLFCVLSLCGSGAVLAQTSPHPASHVADSSLQFLAPLIGRWEPVLPDSVIAQLGFRPVAGHYQWVVGQKAIRMREGYPSTASPDSAQLDGMIFWNPATQVVEFTAVAGHGDGQGRLFRGRYFRHADGLIERQYDAFYRTLADIPGEELGGLRRRYRETVRFVSPDSIATTLEWWHDGAWRPFGPFATGRQTRLK